MLQFASKTATAIVFFVLLLIAVGVFIFYGRSMWVPVVQQITGRQTVADVLAEVGPQARLRLVQYFDQAGIVYPPDKAMLLAIKSTAMLELWAGDGANPEFIRHYDIKAASGVGGPKLREGDKQVPEGLYRITGLNPNSSFHLSMKLNYPNEFDLKHAAADGRADPGSDIFIHGKAQSVGCLAMGDTAIEELFILAADVGIGNLAVAIAPADPRSAVLSVPSDPPWVAQLYQMLSQEFSRFQRE